MGKSDERQPISGYQAQLQAELRRRQTMNPRYSLRAFAQTLGVSPAYLSKVLRGQKHLSVATALKISRRLGFSENETALFCHQVQQASAGESALNSGLTLAIDDDAPYGSLSLEAAHLIADWYHLAIRELSDCVQFDGSVAEIAERLGITREEADLALKRLVRFGLLKKSGKSYKKAEPSITVSTDRPITAMRSFHYQMIAKANQAISEQPVDERDISGLTMPISLDKLDLARQEIKRFRRRMAKLLDSSRPSEVYQLNIQFFRLTNPKMKRGSGK